MISISLPIMPFFCSDKKNSNSIEFNHIMWLHEGRCVSLSLAPPWKLAGFHHRTSTRLLCACLINQQGCHGDGGAGPENGPGLCKHHDPLTAPCVNTFSRKRAEWETHSQGLQGGKQSSAERSRNGEDYTTLSLTGQLEGSRTSNIFQDTFPQQKRTHLELICM